LQFLEVFSAVQVNLRLLVECRGRRAFVFHLLHFLLLLVVLNNIKLYKLRNLSFPELDVAPDGFLLDKLEQVVLLGRLHWFLDVYVESACEYVAVHWDACIDGVIVLVQHDGQKFTQTEHGRLVVNLKQLFDPHLVQQVNEKLLTLFVAHHFSESSQFILIQLLFASPCFQQDLVYIFFQA